MEFEKKYFNPLSAGGKKVDDAGSVMFRSGPEPADVYVYTPRTILALNVALATKRPLLISGEPGSGKSTLARNVADVLGRWYYKETITSRTRAADLLWTFDALRRLSDASTSGQALRDKRYYVEPGKLWWAFDPASAGQRGTEGIIEADDLVKNPGERHPDATDDRTVILLDEIDKADPDVPNDLLEPFDVASFTVRETNDTVTSRREGLLILTTNGERELPPAFLRRCVTLKLDDPEKEWFVRIANQRYGEEGAVRHEEVAAEVMKLRKAAARMGLRQPSTGEYLDALTVCRELGIGPASPAWADVTNVVLWKYDREPEMERERNAESEDLA